MCVCVCVCVLVVQLCLTLCDPMDCSLPGSSVYGILQARILEWVAIPFFKGKLVYSPLKTGSFTKAEHMHNTVTLNGLGNIQCLWIGRNNIIKMSVLLKMIDRFYTIPIKIPEICFTDIDKIILKFMWNGKGTGLAKTILGKNKAGGICLHGFTVYITIVIKIVWLWGRTDP